jgi:NitT/TauT family transport system permease protein
MATAVAAGRAPRTSPTAAAPGTPSRRRQVIAFTLFIVAILAVWEGVKFLGGTPWREPGALPGSPTLWNPPFRWPFANDLNLPHVWNIALAFLQPWQPGVDNTSLAHKIAEAAFITWRSAAIGFVLGALLGLALATLFVHSGLLERALVPYVIASQTVPILALAPMIVFAFGANVVSVVIIATYLTFFPVTIAMIRGLRSFDPRAMELLRSYAASDRQIWWKLRLPASLPYLFTALKIAATAGIVGAIIGEGPGGMTEGLGNLILTFNQYYITGPEKLWAAIAGTAVLGILFFVLILVVEKIVLRNRPRLDYI